MRDLGEYLVNIHPPFFVDPVEQRMKKRFPQGALSNTCAGNGSHPEVDKVLGSIVTWQLQFVYMLKHMVHLVLLPIHLPAHLASSLQLSEILGSSKNIQRS